MAKKLASIKMSDPRGKSASDRRPCKTKTRGNKHHAREDCAQPQMSYILTYVRVALATSDVHSSLEIPATYEIHKEDQNQTCVSTATFESCGTRTTNG